MIGTFPRAAAAAAVALAAALTATPAVSSAADDGVQALAYTADIRSPIPIPPAEQDLQTIVAKRWFKVSDEPLQLEGPVFDADGNLLFVEVFGGRVFRLSPDRELETLVGKNDLGSAGLAVGDDGRIYIAGLGNFKDTGRIVSVAPDGSDMQTVVPASAGYLPDDLVFDDDGGFYFTDFQGTSTEPVGGVYYVSPDGGDITPVLPNMAIANGVALGPDGEKLWATEFSAGRLHRLEMKGPTTVAPFGTAVPYHFTGCCPDSMRTDTDGNVYVSMYGQARVLVFNDVGIPIGQILLPGHDEGRFLHSTSLAISPDGRDVYIVSNDRGGEGGAWIFKARGFASGTRQPGGG
ncbi:SMP-30/gluconolactonase/LRE family protein [Arhodomonas aquaeolei]|nr:SMP-30/gluconolactonase/LRE family protein [Arhodomonas aquaeolei]